MKTTKLTATLLRRLIEEETSKFGDMEDVEDAAKDTKEVDADEQADALDKHIDYVKALKIEESRLTKRLMRIKETKQRILKKLAGKV